MFRLCICSDSSEKHIFDPSSIAQKTSPENISLESAVHLSVPPLNLMENNPSSPKCLDGDSKLQSKIQSRQVSREGLEVIVNEDVSSDRIIANRNISPNSCQSNMDTSFNILNEDLLDGVENVYYETDEEGTFSDSDDENQLLSPMRSFAPEKTIGFDLSNLEVVSSSTSPVATLTSSPFSSYPPSSANSSRTSTLVTPIIFPHMYRIQNVTGLTFLSTINSFTQNENYIHDETDNLNRSRPKHHRTTSSNGNLYGARKNSANDLLHVNVAAAGDNHLLRVEQNILNKLDQIGYIMPSNVQVVGSSPPPPPKSISSPSITINPIYYSPRCNNYERLLYCISLSKSEYMNNNDGSQGQLSTEMTDDIVDLILLYSEIKQIQGYGLEGAPALLEILTLLGDDKFGLPFENPNSIKSGTMRDKKSKGKIYEKICYFEGKNNSNSNSLKSPKKSNSARSITQEKNSIKSANHEEVTRARSIDQENKNKTDPISEEDNWKVLRTCSACHRRLGSIYCACGDFERALLHLSRHITLLKHLRSIRSSTVQRNADDSKELPSSDAETSTSYASSRASTAPFASDREHGFSLALLATVLSSLGRHQEALLADREAVDIMMHA